MPTPPRPPIMVQGCTSSAGKSFLVSALCRYLANQGVRVAPFKAQNMSNQAAVTTEGLEMGRAQYVQALAARVTPTVQMNPVLLKPTGERHSQVVVLGKPDRAIAEVPWMQRRATLWPIVQNALQGLMAQYDQVVIEGAGSPAEINLRAGDIVNMSVALEAQAQVYLVSDIDRGGSYAHLLGTWHCLAPEERALLRGFVLNRFRGDPALLGDAGKWLEDKTGVPVVALVPMTPHTLPEEDTWWGAPQAVPGQVNVALVHYPYASNLDEFDALAHEPGVNLVSVRQPHGLGAFQAMVLPGSKHTAASLQWLRQVGLDRAITEQAAAGVPVLGVCGGLQMLGHDLLDPHGVESGAEKGLGLLDLSTTLALEKTTAQRTVHTAWGEEVVGYEIHHGQSEVGDAVQVHLTEDLGWQQGTVTGVYLHGVLENSAYRQRFLEALGWQGTVRDWHGHLDAELDKVAGLISTSGWANWL